MTSQCSRIHHGSDGGVHLTCDSVCIVYVWCAVTVRSLCSACPYTLHCRLRDHMETRSKLKSMGPVNAMNMINFMH